MNRGASRKACTCGRNAEQGDGGNNEGKALVRKSELKAEDVFH